MVSWDPHKILGQWLYSGEPPVQFCSSKNLFVKMQQIFRKTSVQKSYFNGVAQQTVYKICKN